MANIYCDEGDLPVRITPLLIRNNVIIDGAAPRVGQHFIDHYRNRAADSGHIAAAKQLKKQGVPLEVALAIFGFRSRA